MDHEITFDPGRAESYRLEIEAGSIASPDGLTRVALDGHGAFEAEQERGETSDGGGPGGRRDRPRKDGHPAKLSVRGDIGKAEAERLFYQAAAFPWGRAFPSRPGIPDEAIVVCRLHVKGSESATLKIWLREAEQDPALGPVLETLREQVGKASQGQIYI